MTKTVAEIMTANPITVTPQTDLKTAIKLLVEHRVSGLPVVDEQGKIQGILSESDLMWQEKGIDPPPYIMLLDSVIYLQNPSRHEKEVHKALGQTVGEVMTNQPLTIHGSQSIREAAKLMSDKNLRRLPVVEQDSQKVIGVITQGDIIRSMAQ